MTLFPRRIPISRREVSARILAASNWLLIAAFLAGQGVVLLGMLKGGASEDIAKWELRLAAVFPKMNYRTSGFLKRPDTQSLRLFPGQFEKWFNDHMGFRRRLMDVFHLARYHGWTPRRLSEGPFIGRDGWMYLNHDGCISEFRGTNLLTDDELKYWKQTLEDRRDWLARRGIRYMFVVVPNKHTIYPEHLPASLVRVTEESRLRQLSDYLAKESDVAFIDLTDALRHAKSEHHVYFKSDTHWNAYGAFAGYQEIMKPIRSWFPYVRVSTKEDYEVAVHDCDVSNIGRFSHLGVAMDLAVMSGVPGLHREQVVEFVPRRSDLIAPRDYGGYHRSEAGDEKQQLSSIVVLHDSCMESLSRFLTPNCREVTYLAPRLNDEFPVVAVEEAGPILVIEEIVQRHLAHTRPKNPPNMMAEVQLMRAATANH